MRAGRVQKDVNMPKDPNVILDHYIEVSKSRDIMDPEELQKIIDVTYPHSLDQVL